MSKIKVWAGLVSPEASLLGVGTAAFSLGPHVGFFCACTQFWCLSVSPIFFYKDTCLLGLGPTLMTSFRLSYLFKGPHLL